MHRLYTYLLTTLLPLLLYTTSTTAKSPSIITTTFGGLPMPLHYFEDSDTVLLFNPENKTTYRTTNAGQTWSPLSDVPEGKQYELLKHPYDKHTAVVLGDDLTHWITRDQGATWSAFESAERASAQEPGVHFHARDAGRMLFVAQTCGVRDFFCSPSYWYTVDGFKTNMKPLGGGREDLVSCLWGQSTDVFSTGDEELDKDLVLCVAKGEFSMYEPMNRVIMSKDFFEEDEREPVMDDGRAVVGVTSLAAAKKYIVFAAKGAKTTEMALHVTDDTKTWHRAQFGRHRLDEGAYTLLESTNYSMQVDVMTTDFDYPMGVLLTSNSNGRYFTENIEHTNRNQEGYVDFEKMSNIQGIVMVNTVANWEDIEVGNTDDRNIQSSISFDDGRTWEELKAGNERLHLHSITEQRNMGRLYSSPAPGIVMGIGNTGKFLKDYNECDLYVSDDAGLTWSRAFKHPHMFEFGAQGSVLLAIELGEKVDKFKYSLNHGQDWDDASLDMKIQPAALTTTPDSTSLKFILIGIDSKEGTYNTFTIDFEGLHERTCDKKSDYEDWPARVDEKGKPTCVMGQKQTFRRRKADKKCLVPNDDFTDPEEKRESCECTKLDYECDYNFERNDQGECVVAGKLEIPENACKKNDKTFDGPSGYRLIPGNQCKSGVDLTKSVERSCNQTSRPVVGDQEILSTFTKFPNGKSIKEWYYLERGTSSAGDDETLIFRTDRKEVFISYDHGVEWNQVLKGEKIEAIYPHEYFNDNVYLITDSKTVYYSSNRGRSFHSFNAPEPPSRDVAVLSFHPKQKDWLIWIGEDDCIAGSCQLKAHVSTHGGDKWELLMRDARKCQFVYREDRKDSEKLVFCEHLETDSAEAPLTLLSSDDWFDHHTEVKRDVINFATMAEYIIVASKDGEGTLRVDVTIDGDNFADAQFPANVKVPHDVAYTVLDSSTHAVFMHVTAEAATGLEYGSLVKSNSNGTSYVSSIDRINRNEYGYVDFQKMQGIEGVAIVNRVDNAGSGAAKKLKTYITHNDGAGWALLSRPEDPPNGKPFECQGTTETCSLHLHGYTERSDPRNSYSSPSAVGLMMATGNVGEFLESKKDADTFITRDGGINWHQVLEGNWLWEYGDQGSIIVIVKPNEPVDSILYSLDEGKEWYEFKLDIDKSMIVDKITTVPSDTSRNFLLWGKLNNDLATINIDFSQLSSRNTLCHLDEQSPLSEEGDYYLWSPKHPLLDDDCLFGHVSQLHRKKPSASCYNGPTIPSLHSIARNCSCTREDFECDYNFERGPTGECTLIEGLQPWDPIHSCLFNGSLTEYREVTGYRRIPLTTCSGGRELDYTSRVHPCPGYEDDFNRRHGISGVGLFFAIVIPIAAAAGAGWWVWQNWDGKFGRIQLGDSLSNSRFGNGGLNGGFGGSGAQGLAGAVFDRDAPWVRYPVMALAGVVAILAAAPMVLGSMWRAVSTGLGRRRASGWHGGRAFTSRSSFQRGRGGGGYAVVDEDDEGAFLGEDSEDEA